MSEAGRQRANRRLTWKLAAFTAGSFAFGFALVPLYSLLCNITGAGNEKALTQASARQGGAVDARREVTIELLATLPTVGNWEFRPVVARSRCTRRCSCAVPASFRFIPPCRRW